MFEPVATEGLKGQFSKLLKKSILDGMSNIIGADGARSIIVNFDLEPVMDNPRDFHRRLDVALPVHGALVLERAMIKELYRLLKERFEEDYGEFNYEASVHIAMKLFMASKAN